MARGIEGRFYLSGQLTARSAISVTTGVGDALHDAHCVRDGSGRHIIPGTSLAGVLRRLVPNTELWGPDQGDDATHASWISVDDALRANNTETVETRTGVGINRHTGSATDGFLYSQETIPAGTVFNVDVIIDTPAKKSAETTRFVADLKDAMVSGFSVGSSTTSGLGEVTLNNVSLKYVDFTNATDFKNWLLGEELDLPKDVASAEARAGLTENIPPRLTITINNWQQTAPILVQTATLGVAKAQPLTTKTGDHSDETKLVLPGSSIRGSIRARAERILRTLLGTPSMEDTDFAAQLTDPQLTLVHELFGLAPTGDDAPGHSGAMTVHEVHSSAVANWAALQDALMPQASTSDSDDDRNAAARQQVVAARGEANKAGFYLNEHVAIDRWTGGAADNKLFTLLAPTPGKVDWESFRFTIDLAALERRAAASAGVERQQQVLACLGLLVVLLKDLQTFGLRLGSNTTRGYGEIRFTASDVTFTMRGAAAPELGNLDGQSLENLMDSNSPELANLRKLITEAWQTSLTNSADKAGESVA